MQLASDRFYWGCLNHNKDLVIFMATSLVSEMGPGISYVLVGK